MDYKALLEKLYELLKDFLALIGLAEKFENVENVEVVMADALKMPIAEIEKHFKGDYHIIAECGCYSSHTRSFGAIAVSSAAKNAH